MRGRPRRPTPNGGAFGPDMANAGGLFGSTILMYYCSGVNPIVPAQQEPWCV